MDFAAKNNRTIEDAFWRFHDENPHVFAHFIRYAMEAIKAGKKRLSSKLIINRIRWEMHLRTNSDDGFAINDAFTSHYARLFITKYPQYDSFFELRRLRAAKWAPAPSKEYQTNTGAANGSSMAEKRSSVLARSERPATAATNGIR